jgi:predicted  nucleic acid-binding Zn-ribbon protein
MIYDQIHEHSRKIEELEKKIKELNDEIILNKPDLEGLSSNPNLTIEFIEKHREAKWDWILLSNNIFENHLVRQKENLLSFL